MDPTGSEEERRGIAGRPELLLDRRQRQQRSRAKWEAVGRRPVAGVGLWAVAVSDRKKMASRRMEVLGSGTRRRNRWKIILCNV
jgi:hypothetical protein